MYLKDLGTSEDKLRLFYVVFTENEGLHMVLGYYPNKDSEPYLLDNIATRVVSANLRGDLKPIYSFNLSSSWINPSFDKSIKAETKVKESKYKDVMKKMDNVKLTYTFRAGY